MIPGLSRSSNPSAAGSGGFGGFVGGDADPLEGTRDSGRVGGPGALSSEKAIDQGRLSDVRKSDNTNPQRPVVEPPMLPPLIDVLPRPMHCPCNSMRSFPSLGVDEQHLLHLSLSLCHDIVLVPLPPVLSIPIQRVPAKFFLPLIGPEDIVGRPPRLSAPSRHGVHPRQDDDARPARGPFSHGRMCRGLGQAGVADFDDDVDRFERFGQLAFGLGDVAGIPVHLGAAVSRQGFHWVEFFGGGGAVGWTVCVGPQRRRCGPRQWRRSAHVVRYSNDAVGRGNTAP